MHLYSQSARVSLMFPFLWTCIRNYTDCKLKSCRTTGRVGPGHLPGVSDGEFCRFSRLGKSGSWTTSFLWREINLCSYKLKSMSQILFHAAPHYNLLLLVSDTEVLKSVLWLLCFCYVSFCIKLNTFQSSYS
jgi:hypothetical protein